MKRNNPEGQIQLQIIHYCKAKGYYIGKIKNKGSRLHNRFILDPYQCKGIADLICFAPELFFIEVKAGRNVQSDDQIAFQERCQKSNTPYILAYSLQDVQKFL